MSRPPDRLHILRIPEDIYQHLKSDAEEEGIETAVLARHILCEALGMPKRSSLKVPGSSLRDTKQDTLRDPKRSASTGHSKQASAAPERGSELTRRDTVLEELGIFERPEGER